MEDFFKAKVKYEYKKLKICLDFSVKQGEFISIVGPSGGGKSTSLSLICGLLQPKEGQFFLKGKDITNLKPELRNIGLVFQDYALFPHMNVFQNIAYPLKLKKLNKNQIMARVEDCLKLVKLKGFEKRKINDLSGGEKQRVAIARALINQPDLLLLDEPFSALDAALRLELRDEIVRLNKELGLTTIYVTHDQCEALSISDKILILHQGQIMQFDEPEAIYQSPKSSFVAQFMGESNSLPFSVFKEHLVLSKLDAAYSLLENEKVMFRPEDCEILKPNFPLLDLVSHLRLQGCTVTKTLYEGSRYLVYSNFLDYEIKFYSSQKLQPNEAIIINVPLEKIRMF